MYDFFYKVFYETAKVFMGEQESKHVARMCCLILPGLIFIVVLSAVINLW